MQGSDDGSIGEPLKVENGLIELSPKVLAPEGLHSQDPCPRLLAGTHEGPECYLSLPEAHNRIPSGTL
jgi:hypothetical protein